MVKLKQHGDILFDAQHLIQELGPMSEQQFLQAMREHFGYDPKKTRSILHLLNTSESEQPRRRRGV